MNGHETWEDPKPWVDPQGIRHGAPMITCAGSYCEFKPRLEPESVSNQRGDDDE